MFVLIDCMTLYLIYRVVRMWPEQRAQCAVRSPACHVRGIFLLLLLVMVQMIISLVPFDGVFIRSDKVLISPYRFCQIQQTGEWSCDNVYKSHLYERSQSQGAEAETLSKPHSNSVRVAVYLAVYVPVIIVAFALMGMHSVISDKDEPAIFCSTTFQVGAALLTLAGLFSFLFVYQSYVSWQNITVWFYIYLGVVIELAITSVLTHVLGNRLRSYWECSEMLKLIPA